jgi:hypothetical protein
VAEWSNVPHSKCGVLQSTVGSNPTFSATKTPNITQEYLKNHYR